MSGEFIQRGRYWWQNAAGYRIAAFRVGDALRYSVFAPPISEAEYEGRLKVHYRAGERVPQRRELLGVFDDPESARASLENIPA